MKKKNSVLTINFLTLFKKFNLDILPPTSDVKLKLYVVVDM